MKADDFNKAAESFYRNELKMRHVKEGFRFLEEDLHMVAVAFGEGYTGNSKCAAVYFERSGSSRFVSIARRKVIEDEISMGDLIKLINLILISVHCDRIQS